MTLFERIPEEERRRREEIGKRLRAAREARGISLRDLAKVTGVATSSVHEREDPNRTSAARGRIRPLAMSYLQAVASETWASVQWLETGEGCSHRIVVQPIPAGPYICRYCGCSLCVEETKVQS